MIQPGTGFTTQPGVVALRRTPGTGIGNVQNPGGVPQSAAAILQYLNQNEIGAVEPRLGFGAISISLPGVRRIAATPGFDVKPVPG